MPPPKKGKLYRNTGKLKTITTTYAPLPSGLNQQPTTSSASTTNDESTNATTTPLTPDAEEAIRQLEVELCWCIQTMETSLQTGNINAKQAADTDKTIKLLKNPKTPIIKKRQIMRTAFGDYRAKMAEEEKKTRLKKQQIYFHTNGGDSSSSPSNSGPKSHFVKKSVLQTLGKEFKFEFNVDKLQMNQLNLDNGDDNIKEKNDNDKIIQGICADICKNTKITLLPSENAFKFNFNVENNS